MKLFVTGGTGFIGSQFLSEATRRGNKVVALRRTPNANADASIQWVDGDLESCPREAMEGCEAFVHLAAHGVSMQSDWAGCFRWNLEASLSLMLDACRLGIRRFVICGSCSEYGRVAEHYDSVPTDAPLLPTEPYGASKAALSMAALALCQERNVELIVLRPFHVYGEGEAPARFWPSLRNAAQSGTDFPMTSGEQIRDFTPVELVAREFADALIRSDLVAGKPLIENLGTGIPSTLKEFAVRWWEKWQAPGKLIFGAVPYRRNEVMRYVPALPPRRS